jgi:hypothetical protein
VVSVFFLVSLGILACRSRFISIVSVELAVAGNLLAGDGPYGSRTIKALNETQKEHLSPSIFSTSKLFKLTRVTLWKYKVPQTMQTKAQMGLDQSGRLLPYY